MTSELAQLLASRRFIRFLMARLASITAHQMPMVAVFGMGTVAVALLWTRLFPGLARRDRMMPSQQL